MDFVLPWVNDSDPKWLKLYNSHKKNCGGDSRKVRFRSWDNLKYWFRGVEKFAPWVDNIFFITFGHYPEWLNLNHPKVKLLSHSDFIPVKYLPTFNARTIELNLHHIKELSNEYVFFNDDFFVINHIDEKNFFRNGMPCDVAISNAMTGYPHSFTVLKNISVINKYFSKRKALKSCPTNWFNFKYGIDNIRNILLIPWEHTGFYNPHLPQPSLKSTLKRLWELEYDILNESCINKFRKYPTVNAYLQRYWELASNNFYPININNVGKYFDLHEVKINKIQDIIERQKFNIIALNDQEIKDFEAVKHAINTSLERLLPDKSKFELNS